MTLIETKSKVLDLRIMAEVYSSANEVVETCKSRPITDSRFDDVSKSLDKDFAGVDSLDEAYKLMQSGYAPTVERLKNIKPDLSGQGKRITFRNEVVGYAPIVPLALQGVPNSMINTAIKPIKAKVLNVLYDMTVPWTIDKEDILKCGENLLSAIMELEMQGYRFNLYAIQSYTGSNSCDILCTKVKDANMPIDLKQIAFPLTHTAYFRGIGFDWYSRAPKATYRGGYGHSIVREVGDEKKLNEGFEEIFKMKCVTFVAANVVRRKYGKEAFKEVLSNNKTQEA